MHLKAVIFDLDGVIVHTDRFHYQAWKVISDEMGIPFDQETNNLLRGVSRGESLEIILQKYKGNELRQDEKENLLTKKNNIYCELLESMTSDDASTEVKETLLKIKKMGYRIAIGSSSKNAKTILKKIGLMELFDGISDGNNISKSKPDPEVFLKAAEYIHENPENCLVVEDAEAGIKAAHAANMKAAGIGDSVLDAGAEYYLEHFSNLIGILE